MSKMDAEHLNELLDWLADEVAGRLRSRREDLEPSEKVPPTPEPDERVSPLAELLTASGAMQGATSLSTPDSLGDATEPDEEAEEPEPGGLDEPTPPPAQESQDEVQPVVLAPEDAGFRSHAALLMKRLAIGLLVAVVLVNIPLNARGKSLARVLPTYQGVAVRSGVLVKEVDKPEVYVFQDGRFHWIVDPNAFDHFGFKWENVQDVSSGFLADFPIGNPLYRVLKCPTSPHIYRLENGTKRWIIDIPTFEAEGLVWSDVEMVDCSTLSKLPSGETIPAGHGPAPEP